MNHGRPDRSILVVAVAVAMLPVMGAWLGGQELRRLFVFPPPLEIPTAYLRFSWFAVVAVVALLGSVAWPWVGAIRKARGRTRSSPPAAARGRFPIWGWLALAWTVLWWLLAWMRWEWFAPAQRYTFFPLWMGFIVAVNALTVHRAGSCFMIRQPARWAALFAVSAVCWWGFEWLNRFVRNWHYLGVENTGPIEYAVHATLCFSTVLPAVGAVTEWLGALGSWHVRMAHGPRWAWMSSRLVAWLLVGFGIVSLVASGAFPTVAYPALWVSPLALALALPVLRGQRGLAQEIAAGDWRRAAPWMIAALVCGFFWEMWNWLSLAKWIYTVPGVERWFIFEMPLLGYAGYLPFGLECLLVSEGVTRTGSRANSNEGPT